MEKIQRRIFFWTLVVSFFIITPAVVLTAWGYRLDFQRGVFVRSGSINLKTNPQDFNLYINGKLQPSKQLNRVNNSYNISGLLPKNYDLTISADGFQTWKKTIEVNSGISSEFWNVLLARNNYARTPYATGGAEKFFVSPKNDYVAIASSDDSGTTVKIMKISDKTISNTFSLSGWQFIDDARQENIEWSPNGDNISIPVQKTTTTATPAKPASAQNNAAQTETSYAYFVGDPAPGNSFNLDDQLGKNDLRNVRWDPKDKNYLFFLSGNSLYRANISDAADITTVADNVSSFDLSKTGVYYAQMPNELVFRTDLDGKSNLTQITNEFPDQLSSPNAKLIVFDDMRIAFLNSNNDLYIFNRGDLDTYFKKLGSDVNGMQFSNDGKKLLFWTNNEISVYFTRQWGVQPTRNEDETQDITRYADPLSNVQWFKDYEHVIFSTGPYVKVIELDARDHRTSMDLVKTATNAPFVIYDDSLERLFFTDTQNNVSDIYSIVFPEPGGFLGIFPPPAQQ